MKDLAIKGGSLLSPTGTLLTSGPEFEAGLNISGGRFGPIAGVGVGAEGSVGVDADLIINAEGLIVSPGFIDVQINGGFGTDLLSDPVGMWELGRQLPRHGVTGFLPTIITSPPNCTEAAMVALRNRPEDHVGAQPLGLHFEGPMLSPARPGAHPVHHLAVADAAVIADWSRENGVLLVTIAPELAGATAVIGALVDRGVTVSAGHSEATADQTRAGITAGVTMVTHLFNAMSPLGHRNPNLVGVALAEPKLATSVIVDGVHLVPEVVSLIWQAKGADGLVLVTDAVAPMGMGPGTYRFGGMTTKADEREVRSSEGILAGSILTMDRAVRNLVAFAGCEPASALLTASTTPATVIGETDRGRLETGAVADVVLLDEDLEVMVTICRGRVAFVSEAARDRVPAALFDGR